MVKAAIIGANGYAGGELAAILEAHPEAEVVHLASRSEAGSPFSSVWPGMDGAGLPDFSVASMEEALASGADVIFLALPHGVASSIVTEEVLDKAKVIDLGADFRLSRKSVYEEWYQTEHHAEGLLKEAVYGLPELHRGEIKKARLIANPGCYTTCSILTSAPILEAGLVDEDSCVIVSAASGVTGAGKGLKAANLYCEIEGSFKPYGAVSHRHTPEIEQELSIVAKRKVTVQFQPHLAPMARGILATIALKAKPGVGEDDIRAAYSKYDGEPFVRVSERLPETRFTKGTNTLDISWRLDRRTGNILAFGALDNLVKGAAGQAVENMNLAFGLEETLGLKRHSAAPL